jgi:hypothetical protein
MLLVDSNRVASVAARAPAPTINPLVMNLLRADMRVSPFGRGQAVTAAATRGQFDTPADARSAGVL